MDPYGRSPALSLSHQLHKAGVRRALAPRREPYWGAPLFRGGYVGFRKIDAQRGSWIARLRDEAGHHKYKALGWATDEFDYDQAKAAAAEWFGLKAVGVTADVVTVADACRQYVEDRRREKGESTAHDAEIRFARRIYDDVLGGRALTKLRTPHLKAWREALGVAPSTRNRMFTTLRAALNLAVTHRQVPATAAQEWRDVKPHKGAGKRRDLYLDLAQRRALLAASEGAIRDLIEAAMLTGGRAGELVNATRSQFDARTKSMTFNGKTGARTVPISPAAVRLFKRLALGKLPEARLLVRDDGQPWAHSDWDALVRDAAKKAELPAGACLYTLRHSFITTALTSAMSTLDVARLVGTSVTMIEKHYGHLVASAARERLAKVVMA
jgi:integrase